MEVVTVTFGDFLCFTAFEDNCNAATSPDIPELPEWLLELPEDLDVCIAQRHFEDAFSLLQKANQFSYPLNKDPQLIEIRYINFFNPHYQTKS